MRADSQTQIRGLIRAAGGWRGFIRLLAKILKMNEAKIEDRHQTISKCYSQYSA
jgi:hypothetical protein